MSEKKLFHIEEGILILLLILSMVGIAITDYSPDDGYGYWIIMVFLFALLAILIAWLQSKHKMEDFKKILLEQSLHWSCSLSIVGAAFLVQKSGQMDAHSATIAILLVLSLATMLDGLRVGWRFSMVGIFLGSSAVVTAYTEHFIWIQLAIAVFIVMFTILWEIWMYKRNNP